MAPPHSKKSKTSSNGFYLFMEKYRADQEKLGNRMSIQQAVQSASPHWKELSPQEKEYYKRMAKQDSGAGKYTSLGTSVSAIHKEEQDAIMAKQSQENYISSLVDNLYKKQELNTYKFPVIHTNYLCVGSDGIYATCEVAVAAFNLQEGVRITYHDLMNIDIPLGYTGEVMRRSQDLGIDDERLKLEGKDLLKIYTHITGLLKDVSSTPDEKSPLFTMPECIEPAKSFLHQLCDYPGITDTFRVYDVSLLFYYIHKMLNVQRVNDVGFPTPNLALIQLEIDTFQYAYGLACTKMHEKTDKYTQCSLSKVKRMCFVICDFCCPVAGIDLVPGLHIPQGIHPQGVSMMSASVYGGVGSLSISEDTRSCVSSDRTLTSPSSPSCSNPWKTSKPNTGEVSGPCQESFPSLNESTQKKGKGRDKAGGASVWGHK